MFIMTNNSYSIVLRQTAHTQVQGSVWYIAMAANYVEVYFGGAGRLK